MGETGGPFGVFCMPWYHRDSSYDVPKPLIIGSPSDDMMTLLCIVSVQCRTILDDIAHSFQVAVDDTRRVYILHTLSNAVYLECQNISCVGDVTSQFVPF